MEDVGGDDSGFQLLKGAETGDVAMMLRILNANPQIVQFQDEDGYTALHRAAYSDQPSSVAFLLEQGAQVSARTNNGWTPLHSAVRWNAFSSAEILLRNGAEIQSVSDGGQTPLHLAADSGKHQCLTLLLLQPSISIVAQIRNKAGDTPYDLALRSGNYAHLFQLAKESINNF